MDDQDTSDDNEDNGLESRQNIPDEINLLPLREVVMFPVVVAPLGVGRENSIKLVNESVVGRQPVDCGRLYERPAD